MRTLIMHITMLIVAIYVHTLLCFIICCIYNWIMYVSIEYIIIAHMAMDYLHAWLNRHINLLYIMVHNAKLLIWSCETNCFYILTVVNFIKIF